VGEMMRADEIYRFCESKKYGNLLKEAKISATPTLQRLSLWQQGRCTSRERPTSASGVISTRTSKSTDDDIGRVLEEVHLQGALARHQVRTRGAWTIQQERPQSAPMTEESTKVDNFMTAAQKQMDGPRLNPDKRRIKGVMSKRAAKLRQTAISNEKRQIVLARMANSQLKDAQRLERLAKRGDLRDKTKSRELRYGGIVKLRSKQKRWLWVCVLVLTQKSMMSRLKHYRKIRVGAGLYVIKLQAFVRMRHAQKKQRMHQLVHTLGLYTERISFHLRCWRRCISTNIARSFIRGMYCQEGSSIGVDFTKLAKAFTYKMGFIQRRCRDVLVCRRARVHALTKYFDREEKKIVLQMRRERLEREQDTLTQLALDASKTQRKGMGFANENLAWEAMRMEVTTLEKDCDKLDLKVAKKQEQHGQWLARRTKLHAFMDRKEMENEQLLETNMRDFDQVGEAAAGDVSEAAAWGNSHGKRKKAKRRQHVGQNGQKQQQDGQKQQHKRKGKNGKRTQGKEQDKEQGKEQDKVQDRGLAIRPESIAEPEPLSQAAPTSLTQFGFVGTTIVSPTSTRRALPPNNKKKLSLISPSAMVRSTSSLLLTSSKGENGAPGKRPEGGLRIVPEAMRTRFVLDYMQEKKQLHDAYAYAKWQRMMSDWQLFGCTQGFEDKVKTMLRLNDGKGAGRKRRRASIVSMVGSKTSEEGEEEEDEGKGPAFPIFLIYYRTTKGDLHDDFVWMVKRAIAKQLGHEKKRRQSVVSLYEGRVVHADQQRRNSAIGGSLPLNRSVDSIDSALAASAANVFSLQRKGSQVSLATALKVASAMKAKAKEAQVRKSKRDSHMIGEHRMSILLPAGARATCQF
jgi:hypothetical protein